MFIFPLLFLFSFILCVKEIIAGNKGAFLIFLIFGLSFYTTAMSVTFTLGLKAIIPTLQSLKEILVVSVLALNIFTLKTKPRFHLIDYLIFAFIAYLLAYAILPIGTQPFFVKFMALKSMCFYMVVYFAARLTDFKRIYISKYFYYIVILAIGAGCIVIFEVVTQIPFPFRTGYFDYSYAFFHLDADGPYGLKATFNSDSGNIRFAGFFTSPLELAGATVVALAVILSLYTDGKNRLNIDKVGVAGFVATVICILFSLSRAPLASYFIVIYVYCRITHKRSIINVIHSLMLLGVFYVIYLFWQYETNHTGLVSVLINTINFSDPSSVGHLLAWVEGITAIISSPFGLGLGTSGRVAASLNEITGGENQLIIIGVQAGVIAIVLYTAILVMFIRMGFKWVPVLRGNKRKICMAVLLIKIGFCISTLTSEVESSTYLSYLNWFLSGLFVSVLMDEQPQLKPAIQYA